MVRLCGSLLAWPLAAIAQQAARPVIGFLNSGSPDAFSNELIAFRQGLTEGGYVDGKSVTIEYRWADGAYDRLPDLANELIRRQAAVIVAGGPPAARAAKAATKSIPIVFTSGGNPVGLGLVSSLNQPGANITGVSFLTNELAGKRLEIVRQLLPSATSVGLLVNPRRPSFESELTDTQGAISKLGLRLHVSHASDEQGITSAFASFAKLRVHAILVASDPFFLTRRKQMITLAARSSIPAMYNLSEYVEAGGLMSYSPSLKAVYRQAGVYAARILKGAKPSDLPVVQPTSFELVINLTAAKALGLAIPKELLLRADQVIE